jgi:methionyl-tRNA formyltransferase
MTLAVCYYVENMKKKVLYIGLDPKTIVLFGNSPKYELVGTALISNFLVTSLNPANFLFQLTYKLRYKNKMRTIELMTLHLFNLINAFSSQSFRNYTKYLNYICTERIRIYDIDKIVDLDPLRQMNIEVGVVNVWGKLKMDILSIPQFGMINIHPSKLPKYRGALPTLWTLKNRDSDSAVTYFLMDEKIDNGLIINQNFFTITKSDDWLTLEKKISDTVEKTLLPDIEKYLNGELTPYKQEIEQATDTGRYEDYKRIDWGIEDTRDIYNKINLYPYLDPGEYCYFLYKDNPIYIKKSQWNKKERNNNKINRLYIKGFRTLVYETRTGFLTCKLFRDVSFAGSFFLLFARSKNLQNLVDNKQPKQNQKTAIF